jgi:hypothetical protein
MSIIRSIEINHFNTKKNRGWDRTFWFFDIHATILRPNYQLGNIPKEFYPMAKETLQLLSKLDDVVMILYTCSHPHEIKEYLKFFVENEIHFKYVNENPEVMTDVNGYGNYDKKPYMNVLFEDKSGFEPETEWSEVYELMFKYYGEIKSFK